MIWTPTAPASRSDAGRRDRRRLGDAAQSTTCDGLHPTRETLPPRHARPQRPHAGFGLRHALEASRWIARQQVTQQPREPRNQRVDPSHQGRRQARPRLRLPTARVPPVKRRLAQQRVRHQTTQPEQVRAGPRRDRPEILGRGPGDRLLHHTPGSSDARQGRQAEAAQLHDAVETHHHARGSQIAVHDRVRAPPLHEPVRVAEGRRQLHADVQGLPGSEGAAAGDDFVQASALDELGDHVGAAVLFTARERLHHPAVAQQPRLLDEGQRPRPR